MNSRNQERPKRRRESAPENERTNKNWSHPKKFWSTANNCTSSKTDLRFIEFRNALVSQPLDDFRNRIESFTSFFGSWNVFRFSLNRKFGNSLIACVYLLDCVRRSTFARPKKNFLTRIVSLSSDFRCTICVISGKAHDAHAETAFTSSKTYDFTWAFSLFSLPTNTFYTFA